MFTNRFTPMAATVALAMLLTSSALAGDDGDRVLWRFDLDSAISGSFVAVGAAGTIYTGDNQRLYAVNPDGSLRWTHTGAGGSKPIDFLADGAILTGRGDRIIAINLDGSTRWEFTWDTNGNQQQLAAGPSVGPDGNIYALTETDTDFGLGAFSLTPQGNLRWSDEGDPVFDNINATNNRRIYFTNNRLFFAFGFTQAGGSFNYGYDLDGDQTNSFDDICNGQPRTDPLHRVILATSCGVVAVDPIPEEVLWTTSVGSNPLIPAIGQSGTIYSGAWGGKLSALDTNGNIIWQSPNVNAQKLFTVAEESGELLYVGVQFGSPNTIGAVDIADGSTKWSFLLRVVNGHNEFAWSSEAGFSPNKDVAYITTRFSSNGAPGALYAIQLGEVYAYADLNCDGVVDDADVSAMVLALLDPDEYVAQYPNCKLTNGDLHGGDLQIFVQEFMAP